MRQPQVSVTLFSACLLLVTAVFILSACSSPGGAPVVSRDSAPSKKKVGSHYAIVKRGDTLYGIAWQAGVNFQRLAEWNQIRYPYTIYVGQQLRLIPLSASRTGGKTTRNKTTGRPQSLSKTQTASQKHKKTASTPSILVKRAAKSTRSPSKEGSARTLRWMWPTDGKVVQGYSRRDPARKGIKIDGRLGQPVRAIESGKIVYSGSGLIGYGKLIIIKHNSEYLSAYGYNKKLLVSEGDEVSRGEQIAEMGLALDNKPLLHFEIRRAGKPVNPKALLPKQH